VGEYLLAAKAAGDKPAIDDFMLIADPGDLNPAMIVRWQAYLEKLGDVGKDRAAAATHPVWGPWFRMATIPDDKFAADAARLCDEWAVTRDGAMRSANPLVVTALIGSAPPQSLADVANRYGALMKSIHVKWQALVREAVILKRPAPSSLDDPLEEELRLELYGESAPANVPSVFGWGFLSLLPDRASQGQYQKLLKDVEQWLIHGPGAPARAMVLLDGQPYDSRVFIRGNPNRLGDAVSRHFLTAIPGSRGEDFTRGSGRLELARAIVDPANPLTARVAVNRIWQYHFGCGCVRTPGDFGLRSDPPTHPELLDWLASEFVDPRSHSRWSLKRIHRVLMTSSAYQQSSRRSSPMDPENRWLTHANRSRLDFEATHDALVWITGRMDDRVGGPSQQILGGGFHPRRTLYAYVDRQDPPGLLSVFDVPSPAATSAARDTTTVSPQALYLMNGPLVATVADLVLARPDLARLPMPEPRIRLLYQLFFARDPSVAEVQLALDYLGANPSGAAWQQFAQALLLTNEFVFVD
jgi:hypothetical protein